MSAKHTPGPWEACGNLVRTVRKADGSGGYLIAECPVTMPQRAEDARLIAAAPELLAALREVTDMLLEWHADFPKYIGDNEEKAIGAAHAAIAKAEGKA